MTPGASRTAIRSVAIFEAFKALLSLAAAFGLLLFLHENVSELAVRLVTYFHLNPAAKYPRLFLEAAANTGSTRLLWLALGAAAYTLLRAAEAYGLWYERAWAEVLAAASTALYIPFELAELGHNPNGLGFAILAVNVGVVWLMLHALVQRRRAMPVRQQAPSC